MSARQRLLNTAAESYSMGDDEYIKDSEALRELDQLIESMVKLGNGGDSLNPNDYWLAMNEWLERAAQAGYGEK